MGSQVVKGREGPQGATMSRYAQAEMLRQREKTNAMLMGLGPVPQATSATFLAKANFGMSRNNNKTRLEPPAVGRLRAKIASRGLHGMHDFVRLLRIMDDNGDGVLTKDELQFGLEDLGVRMNSVEVQEVFAFFDRDHDGAISQAEFLRGLRGPLCKSRKNAIEVAFASLDKTRDGCVTLEELELVYDASRHPAVEAGKQSAAQALRDFLRQWDHLEDETEVNDEEFMQYHKNLSAMVERDEEFIALVYALWRIPISNEIDAKTKYESSVSENSTGMANSQVCIGSQQFVQKQIPQQGIYETEATRAQRHPDAPRPGKPTVPQWIRFDGITLCYSLYYKEITRAHAGLFDPKTRTFDTKEERSFRIRTFVLRYFLEDDTITVSENTSGEGRPLQFLGRRKSPVLLKDMLVGSKIELKGLMMHIVDADKKARDYMKQTYPDIRMLPALSVPEDPPCKEELRQQNFAQDSPVRRRISTPEISSSSKTSRKFIENDGKVMQFAVEWNDPGVGGGRRTFKLLYYLSDDTMELREVNERNSGRQRQALLNLNRQALPNPMNDDCAPYRPEDLYVGAVINAFGRAMRIINCDMYAKRFLESCGLPSELSPSEQKDAQIQHRTSLQGCPPFTIPLGLYSDAVDQKLNQILEAVRATTEQRTRFGTRFDQIRMLRAYLKRFAVPSDKDESTWLLDREGFTLAMAGFSCFGSDCEFLYERLQAVQGSDITAQTIISAVYGDDHREAPVMVSATPVPLLSTGSISSEDELIVHTGNLTSRVQSLIQSIRNKMEVSTQFGELHQQKRALQRLLQNACVGAGHDITRNQFRGAMAQVNCWEQDANAIFDAYDHQQTGKLSCALLVENIFHQAL